MVTKTHNFISVRWLSAIRCSFAFSLALLICSASIAAEFRYEKDRRGQMLIFLEGPIEKGDAEKFESTLADALAKPFLNQLVLVLDSPGGNVSEAIKIGRLARELLITTRTAATGYRNVPDQFDKDVREPWGGMSVVYGQLSQGHPEAGHCWSACTIVFASGVIRQSVDNIDLMDQTSRVPTIGIHRPKFPDEDFSELSPTKARDAHASLLKNMGDFLIELGTSREFVARTMAIPSHDIDLVSSSDLYSMIPSIEPFFEDWIAAKCGRKTDVLNPTELALYQRQPVGGYRYSDWGFDDEKRFVRFLSDAEFFDFEGNAHEIDALVEQVFPYSQLIRFCQIVTVKTHQTNWLNDRRGN